MPAPQRPAAPTPSNAECAKKCARKSNAVALGPVNREINRLIFGVEPKLKSAQTPANKRAREDSNL